MYAADELSHAVRTRRREMGLSQKDLASLSGLSRATIVQIERGTIKDLGFNRTAAMLHALGLGLTITQLHPTLHLENAGATPLDEAARTASVGYTRSISPSLLGDTLRTGDVPVELEPHVCALLEEGPVSMLANMVEQVHVQWDMPREQVWANMRSLAGKLKATRNLWNVKGRPDAPRRVGLAVEVVESKGKLMNSREAEGRLLARCAETARSTSATAETQQEANVYRVAAMLLRSKFPQESAHLMDACNLYFGSHPNEQLTAEEVVRKGWVFSLPRLRDMLAVRLQQG
jgi:transcriptional regulator with XRE-family HTH domain